MKSKIIVRVENSAPSQSKPAKSVSWATDILRNNGVNEVVDLGCGRLRNLKVLKEGFKSITLVDTLLQCQRIRDEVKKNKKVKLLSNIEFVKENKKYDAIFMISILHTIPIIKERKNLISLAISKLKLNGYLIIDVPTGVTYYRNRCTGENKYKDGYLMGNGNIKTFYKQYFAAELDKLLTESNQLKLFKKIYFDKHLTRIMVKD